MSNYQTIRTVEIHTNKGIERIDVFVRGDRVIIDTPGAEFSFLYKNALALADAITDTAYDIDNIEGD